MSHVIEILISPRGETTLQTKGFQGSECLQASRFLEQALGTQSQDQKTSEFYETGTTSLSVQQ